MTFWHTILAIVLGNAIYDLAWLVFLGEREHDDDDRDPPATV